ISCFDWKGVHLALVNRVGKNGSGLAAFVTLLERLNDSSEHDRSSAERELKAMGPEAADLLLIYVQKLKRRRKRLLPELIGYFCLFLCVGLFFQWSREYSTGRSFGFPVQLFGCFIFGFWGGYATFRRSRRDAETALAVLDD